MFYTLIHKCHMLRQLQVQVQMTDENVFIVLSLGDLGTKNTIRF